MISIIIPVWNQHDMTAECLAAVERNTGMPHEVVLIDNGSNPPYRGAAVRNIDNLGFPVAVNQGIRVSNGDIICLLNNDVIVTPVWAELMVKALDRYDIVGPLTNYVAGVQKNILPPYYDDAGLDAAAREWAAKHDGRTKEVNWVIGFLFMFRRSLYDEIGEFDESLWPCSGEEIDFCMRAKKSGRRIGIVKDVYVHHEGSQTFRAMDVDYAEIVQRNNKHIEKRWGKTVWHDQEITGNGNGVRVNVGCGTFKLKGFVNVDQNAEVSPDLTADATALPYQSESVDEIYAGHIIEHFDWRDGEKALWHWFDLLRPGGKISISVPDFDFLVRQYIGNPTPARLRDMNDLYIYSYRQKSPHKYAYSEPLLRELMMKAGFVDIERMPIDHPYFPFAVDWQVGLEGRKPQ